MPLRRSQLGLLGSLAPDSFPLMVSHNLALIAFVSLSQVSSKKTHPIMKLRPSNLLPVAGLLWGLLMLVSLASVMSHSDSERERERQTGGCRISRKTQTFRSPDGNCVASIKFPTCSGVCQSLTYYEVDPRNNYIPMQQQRCSCCSSIITEISYRKRKLTYHCSDNSTRTELVYLPRPLECGCVECSPHL